MRLACVARRIPFDCMHSVVVPQGFVRVTFWNVRASADDLIDVWVVCRGVFELSRNGVFG